MPILMFSGHTFMIGIVGEVFTNNSVWVLPRELDLL